MYVQIVLTLLMAVASAQLHILQDIQDLIHCERDTATTAECLSCCKSANFTIPPEERQCERLCPTTHPHVQAKRQFFLGGLGNIWSHIQEFQHCETGTATSAECIECCQSAHFTIPLEERSCELLCNITHPSGKRQLFLGGLGNIWSHIQEFQHCETGTATSAECIECCESANFTIPLEERSCESLCPITHPSGKRQLFLGGLGNIWSHIQDFRHCERDTNTTAECLTCCQSAHFTIALEERQCERLCPITHPQAKRQLFLGGLGNIWSHIQEFQHCETGTATSAECIECCQSAHFTIPLEERSCELLCPITHPSGKRQLLGDWFHIQDFRHCERDTNTTAECLTCCQSAHFTVALEERQCERLCPITHPQTKRQLFLGGLGNIWSHIQEFQHCETGTATSAECIECCQSAHFTIPLEERSCESLCPITHHTTSP